MSWLPSRSSPLQAIAEFVDPEASGVIVNTSTEDTVRAALVFCSNCAAPPKECNLLARGISFVSPHTTRTSEFRARHVLACYAAACMSGYAAPGRFEYVHPLVAWP